MGAINRIIYSEVNGKEPWMRVVSGAGGYVVCDDPQALQALPLTQEQQTADYVARQLGLGDSWTGRELYERELAAYMAPGLRSIVASGAPFAHVRCTHCGNEFATRPMTSCPGCGAWEFV